MLAATESPSFDAALEGITAGDQAAARALYLRFVDRLILLASAKLDRRLGPRADPESVAQSVFESFFVRQWEGQYQLHNWAMVFGLLSHITFRKCLNRNRDANRLKRGQGKVVSLEDWQAAASDPGPEHAAIMSELLDNALAGFDAEQRVVIDAYMQGSTVEKAAETSGFSTRTVQRILKRFQNLLRGLNEVE